MGLDMYVYSPPTVKQHLAAIRMCFDWLVTGQIIPNNPSASVRGPKYIVKRGKTPVLSANEARQLLDSIDCSTAVGLRDRALIGTMSRARAYCLMGGRLTNQELAYVQITRGEKQTKLFIDRDHAGPKLSQLAETLKTSGEKKLAHDLGLRLRIQKDQGEKS